MSKLHRPGESGHDYMKKLEATVQHQNDRIQKSRIELKNMKKECQNLKDSNENHVFINEKLNQALKKATQKIEELEKALDSEKNKNAALL